MPEDARSVENPIYDVRSLRMHVLIRSSLISCNDAF